MEICLQVIKVTLILCCMAMYVVQYISFSVLYSIFSVFYLIYSSSVDAAFLLHLHRAKLQARVSGLAKQLSLCSFTKVLVATFSNWCNGLYNLYNNTDDDDVRIHE